MLAGDNPARRCNRKSMVSRGVTAGARSKCRRRLCLVHQLDKKKNDEEKCCVGHLSRKGKIKGAGIYDKERGDKAKRALLFAGLRRR